MFPYLSLNKLKNRSMCAKTVWKVTEFFWSEYGKMRTRKNSIFWLFSHSVKGHQINITRVILVFVVLTSNNKLPAFPSAFMVKFDLFPPIGFPIRKHLFKFNRKNIEASLDVILVSLLLTLNSQFTFTC